jgi:hypothetical protein
MYGYINRGKQMNKEERYIKLASSYSRFLRILDEYDDFLDTPSLNEMLDELELSFEANRIYSDLKYLVDKIKVRLSEVDNELSTKG